MWWILGLIGLGIIICVLDAFYWDPDYHKIPDIHMACDQDPETYLIHKDVEKRPACMCKLEIENTGEPETK